MAICLVMLLVLGTMLLIRFATPPKALEPGSLAPSSLGSSRDSSRLINEQSQQRSQTLQADDRAFADESEIERVQRIFGTIQKNGIWLPITSSVDGESQADLNEKGQPGAGKAETPLYITTGSLPFGQVGQEYLVSMQAVGGREPYRWSVESGQVPEPLALDPATGQISGLVEEPNSGRFRIRVTDADSQSDIAEYELAIEPTARLELMTDALPAAHSGEKYLAALEAAGGLPPYRWSLEGEFGLIGTFAIDSQSGVIQASLLPDLESSGVPLRVVVQDQQVAVEKDLILPVTAAGFSGDETENGSQGKNGTGDVNGQGIDEGEHSERKPAEESAIDTDDEDFNRSTSPPTHPGSVAGVGGAHGSPENVALLTAALGLNRIGLSWQLPTELDGSAVRVVRSENTFSGNAGPPVAIFEGVAASTVDRRLPPGSYSYALFVAGLEESVAELTVTLPPDSEIRPFGKAVPNVNLLHPGAFQAGRLPEIVTGPPRGTGLGQASSDVVSLGAASNDDNGNSAPYGGTVTIDFVSHRVWNGPGKDFTVFENVFYLKDASGSLDPTSRFMEPATVAVSQDGVTFRQFPIDFSPRYHPDTGELNLRHPFAYHRGFAGINPVLSNGSFPDPTDPTVSGGDSFDIGELGFDWIRYVRIQSIGDRWLVDSTGDLVPHNREAGAALRSFNKSGFDLDAVAAIWHHRVESQ